MSSFTPQHYKIGILGGGQLGRMLIQNAIGKQLYISIVLSIKPGDIPDTSLLQSALLAQTYSGGDWQGFYRQLYLSEFLP